MKRFFRGSLVCFSFVLLCSRTDIVNNGGGDDVTTGCLYYQNGSYAADCRVVAVRSATVPGSSGLSVQFETFTDDRGRYSFDSIPADMYNIFARHDTLASCRMGVELGNVNDSGIFNDTLKPAGGIRGIVRLSGSPDSRRALILMIGGTVCTWPDDSSGNFSLPGLAEGAYRIRFLAIDPRYYVLDTAFSVKSGEDTDVGTIILQQPEVDTFFIRDRYVAGVWGPNKTYKIMCTVVIPEGERLEIREGTHIVMMGDYDFGTDGSCFARGAVDNPVVFTYGFNFTRRGWHWMGSCTDGDDTACVHADSLVFNNCIIEYCQQLHFKFDRPPEQFYFEMTNCVLRHMSSVIRIQMPADNENRSGPGMRIVFRNDVFHNINTILPYIENPIPIINVQDGVSPWPCDDPSLEIVNNIFFHEPWGLDCRFAYNCYGEAQADSIVPGDSIRETCVFDDPGFIDFQNGNYRLRPDSPCRGAGINGEDMGLEFK